MLEGASRSRAMPSTTWRSRKAPGATEPRAEQALCAGGRRVRPRAAAEGPTEHGAAHDPLARHR
eukprot:14481391-Alexandrium_andersonii.AAC.1